MRSATKGAPPAARASGCSGVPSSLRSDRPSAALRIPGAALGLALALLGGRSVPAQAGPPKAPPAWREVTGPWTGAPRAGVGSPDTATACAQAGEPVFVWTNGDAVWAQVGRDGAPARVGTPVARPSALRVGVLRGALLVVWTGPDGRTPYGHATCTRSDGEARWTFVGGDGPGVTGARAAPLDEESSLEVVAVDGAEALVHRTPRGTHEVRRSRDMLLGRAATGRGARWVPLYEGGAARLLTAPVVWEGPRPAWREDAGPWRGAHTLAVVASGVAGCAPAGAPVLAWSTPDGTYARADGVDVSLAGPGSVGLALAAHAGTVFASWVEGDRARVAACHDGHWARVTESAAVAGTGGDPARERAIDGATLRVDPTPDGAYALTLTEGATPATLLRAERPLRLGEPAGIGRDLWVPVFEDARARLFVQEAP